MRLSGPAPDAAQRAAAGNRPRRDRREPAFLSFRGMLKIIFGEASACSMDSTAVILPFAVHPGG